MKKLIAGLDEVGYGSLAGPILIAVTVVPEGYNPRNKAGDSKKFSKKKRIELAPLLAEEAIYVGLGWASAEYINRRGVTAAWQFAASLALKNAPELEHLYVDGIVRVSNHRGPQTTVIKGDDKMWCIGASSIIAKVSRDLVMAEMAEYYPGYGWESNSGYGSKQHREALQGKGVTPLHRDRYVRKILSNG